MESRCHGIVLSLSALVGPCLLPALAQAQTGVSDDRVSLPDGPGSLEGIGDNANVNPNMGAMSYSVDIVLPTGFAGATPTVGLGYSSSSGSSVVGIGWSMSLPYIERMTSRGLPEYTRDDLFVADGGDQLVLSAEADTDSPVYRSRYESGFVRYTWLDAGAGAEGSWKAEHPDGSVSYYGATADGDTVDSARFFALGGTFRYLLTSTVDVYGHEVRYTYGAHGVVPLIERIEYLFDAAGTARHGVTFDYDDARQDKLSDARSGSNELLESRLTGIRITTGGAQARRYALDYEDYDAAGGFSRLASVKTYGTDDGLYPIEPTFEYQQGLGALCAEADCGAPKLYEMGSVAAGVATGRASLIDINGDALPDLIDASVDNAAHRFYLNRYNPSTGSNTFDPEPVESALGDSGAFPLGSRNVQMLDFNGDGLSDLLNAQDRTVLINRGRPNAQGRPDWARLDAMAANGDLPSFANGNIRYLDYDGDRRIDLITSTSDSTIIYRNDGQGGFPQADGVAAIGLGFVEDGLELEDMNGDGLADPVVKRPNEVRYRLNLGRGHWSGETVVENVTLSPADLEFADLEDINGDSLTDLVVVVGGEVRYQLNRNGKRFDDVVTLSALLEGSIPVRNQSVAVLYADMNGNGSDDIVWVTEAGQVSYLEMFPVRPNLLSRITNGIGMVTNVTYGSSVAEQARDGGAGNAGWPDPLPTSMQVVKAIDTYAEQADPADVLHDVAEYTYGGGYYDGDEKQFRGYAHVEEFNEGDDSQQSSRQLLEYEVGDDDGYRFGRELSTVVLGSTSGGQELPLLTRESQYDDCEVDGLERADPDFPVRSICLVESREILQEQAPEAEWKTTVTRMAYNGYGHVTLESELGVDGVDGDEQYTETTYIEPGADTDGKWILGKPARVVNYGDPANKTSVYRETLTFYDAPFEGLPAGKLTHGKATHVQQRVADGEYVDTERQSLNEDGMTAEVLDPNGTPGDMSGHRTQLVWDQNLLVKSAAILSDAAGGYTLERHFDYDPIFRKPAEATDATVYANGAVVGAETSVVYRYDEFGRLSTKMRAPYDDAKATQRMTYELSSPMSRAQVSSRSVAAGPVDMTEVVCFDGLGRTVQTRKLIGAGQYQVDGYSVMNRKGKAVKAYQPYRSDSDACETSASRVPAGTLSVTSAFDALDRPLSVTNEDGTASRVEYGPLVVRSFEEDDNDAASPNFDTPNLTREDGLGRVTSFERALSAGEYSVTSLVHDELGNLVQVTDAAGNKRTQAYDGLDRVVRATNPNSGALTLKYDAASNLLERTDAITTIRFAYDTANRQIATWDAADEAGTRTTKTYDRLPDCPDCTHAAGRVVEVRYPLGADAVGDALGIDRLGYDARGNMNYRSRSLEGHVFETRLEYDLANRLSSKTTPDGHTQTLRYDGASRLLGIEGVIDSVTYDPRSDLVSMAHTNGVVETMTHDARRRLVSAKVARGEQTLFGVDLTLSVDGSLEAIMDTATARPGRPTHGVKLTNDAWHRTSSAEFELRDGEKETVTTEMDALDNVASITSSAGAESAANVGTLSYDAARPNAATAAGALTYGYDTVGRMTNRGDTTLERDWRGGISRVLREGKSDEVSMYASRGDRAMKLSEGGVTYYIDPDFEVRDGVSVRYTRASHRVSRTSGDTLAAAILSDLAPATADGGRFTPQGDDHIDAGDAWLAQAAAAGLVELSGGPAPSPVMRLLRASARRLLLDDAPEAVHLHADRLGSLVLATNGAGEVSGERSYYATGQIRESEGYVDAYGFTDLEVDEASGLIRSVFRNLDPLTGRWDESDPLFSVLDERLTGQLGSSTAGYAYAANAPFDGVDPSGLLPEKVKAAGRAISKWAKSRVSPRTWWKERKEAKRAQRVRKWEAKMRAARPEQLDALTMEQVLADPTELDSFREFTKSEFSNENIDFVVAVQTGIDPRTQQPISMVGIVNSFIGEGAERQINISADNAKEFLAKFTQACNLEAPVADKYRAGKAAFEGPVKVVMGLMGKDSLQRYKASDRAKNLY